MSNYILEQKKVALLNDNYIEEAMMQHDVSSIFVEYH